MITIPDTFLLQTTERRVTSVRTSHRMNLIFILCFLSSLTDGERIPQNADEQINKHMIRQMTRKMNGKSSNTTMIKQQNEREREKESTNQSGCVFYYQLLCHLLRLFFNLIIIMGLENSGRIAIAWNTRYAGVIPFWYDNMPDVIPWFRFS